MNKRVGAWMLGAALVVALALGAGISRAASNGRLQNITANCHGFSLEASFRGTVDEGGYDYVRLRVIDSRGETVYQAAPWRVRYGRFARMTLAASYQRTPAAGPLLFVLEDFEEFGQRQLESLATEVVDPGCPAIPMGQALNTTTTCTARLRMGPGLNFRWREFVDEGTPILIIGRLYDASWLEVRAADGKIGWVFDGLCVPGSPEEGTYLAAPVTFFRNADEVLQYEAAP